ncbi:Fis family transcriptional regulator [Hydrogenimonas sp.]|uniref:Fis family transcriptional regulator n=1 Tax=Hydrogenimonas sp. TaxID=2231112 RepID=UPI00262AB811|nr:Fis family transcriptional regulator [Hydrogenimonas sp.]
MVKSNNPDTTVAVAVQVAATNFIAVSKPLKEALKSANLLKTLKFNTLISGEPGTGRHTLAKYMMPDAPVVHGDDSELYQLVEKHAKLIVDRFESIEMFPKFFQWVQKHGTQIIAVTEKGFEEKGGTFFSVSIVIPPLEERIEDIPPLVEKFKMEILSLFGEQDAGNFTIDMDRLDISQNAFSLRKSIMLQYLVTDITDKEILDINERYLTKRLENGEDLYRQMLYLYEVPLIRAGMKQYKSQLKMSRIFGLNRNTLRKKINEWRRYLS